MESNDSRRKIDVDEIDEFVTDILNQIEFKFADRASPFGAMQSGVATRRAMALWVLLKKIEERFQREWPWPNLGLPGEPGRSPEWPTE